MVKVVSFQKKLDLEQRFQRGMNLMAQFQFLESFQAMQDLLEQDLSSELYLGVATEMLKLYHNIQETDMTPEDIEHLFDEPFRQGEVLDVSDFWMKAAHETIDIRCKLSYLQTEKVFEHLDRATELSDDCVQEISGNGHSSEAVFDTHNLLSRVFTNKAEFIYIACSPRDIGIVAKQCSLYGCEHEELRQDFLHIAEMNMEICLGIKPEDGLSLLNLREIRRMIDYEQ